jgi:hypothetical protein
LTFDRPEKFQGKIAVFLKIRQSFDRLKKCNLVENKTENHFSHYPRSQVHKAQNRNADKA